MLGSSCSVAVGVGAARAWLHFSSLSWAPILRFLDGARRNACGSSPRSWMDRLNLQQHQLSRDVQLDRDSDDVCSGISCSASARERANGFCALGSARRRGGCDRARAQSHLTTRSACSTTGHAVRRRPLAERGLLHPWRTARRRAAVLSGARTHSPSHRPRTPMQRCSGPACARASSTRFSQTP